MTRDLVIRCSPWVDLKMVMGSVLYGTAKICLIDTSNNFEMPRSDVHGARQSIPVGCGHRLSEIGYRKILVRVN